MGSNFNFSNFGTDPPQQVNNRPPGNGVPLARQPSVYSLTFDEFQNSLGVSGKDFGSMNMDELLKNIWTAEENQTTASAGGLIGQDGTGGCGNGGNYLQRQGSLTLPRTLSQKTVDEVWRNITQDFGGGKDGGDDGGKDRGAGGGNTGGPAVPQGQQTLGEITLEEFLVRAGVVREDTPQFNVKPGNGGLFGGLAQGGNNNNSALGVDFQQMGKNANLMGLRNFEGESNIPIHSSNLPLTVNGVRLNQRSVTQPQQQPHQQHILPKQPASPFASQFPSPTRAQLGSPGIRSGIMGITDQVMNNNLIPSSLQGGGMGMVGLGAGPVGVGTGSPANPVSSDGIRSNGDSSSASPVPYVFNSGMRGRKCSGAVEKVIERRQRRMIKNRESAARSRARKQAYTMELEAEVAKLKEENEQLRKKQAEMMEAQKNQVMEMINVQQGAKKQCLRRTQTGPW